MVKEIDDKCKSLEENATKLTADLETQKQETLSLRNQLEEVVKAKSELAEKNYRISQIKIYQKLFCTLKKSFTHNHIAVNKILFL
jgi:Skp family chaperone for outer membrane proteins